MLRVFFRQPTNDGLEDVLCPRCVADYGALDGRDGDVEEAMLAVDGEALEETFWLFGTRRSTMGEEDSKDGLEEGGVER